MDFLVGLAIGAAAGMLASALCRVAREADDRTITIVQREMVARRRPAARLPEQDAWRPELPRIVS